MPEYVTALLSYLGGEIARVGSNRLQQPVEPPTGWGGTYATTVFTMRGYHAAHDEDELPAPQFEATVGELGTIVLRWYKHLGRCRAPWSK